MSNQSWVQYGFYLVVILLGGVGVKLGIVTTTDVVTLLAGLGIGHGVGISNLASQALSGNTQALSENTQATVANTAIVTQPQTKEGV